jgi:hypothetical protein
MTTRSRPPLIASVRPFQLPCGQKTTCAIAQRLFLWLLPVIGPRSQAGLRASIRKRTLVATNGPDTWICSCIARSRSWYCATVNPDTHLEVRRPGFGRDQDRRSRRNRGQHLAAARLQVERGRARHRGQPRHPVAEQPGIAPRRPFLARPTLEPGEVPAGHRHARALVEELAEIGHLISVPSDRGWSQQTGNDRSWPRKTQLRPARGRLIMIDQ